ncbi:MAG: NDMA-dependent alcohol dehydrogenase [Actinomycetota bacterium]|nr:NDMA-dependent alcohol dehydrogenase [Actinomycetota bacterium]
MQTRGAVIRSAPGKFEIMDLELDEPRQNELQIKMVASGLCHSDDHLATGDLPVPAYPICGGHEGGGIVHRVGPNTVGWEEGDHVVMSFLPGCGKCRWCATGHQNLCDLGQYALAGSRFEDPTDFRMHDDDGRPVPQFLGISTFAEYTTVSINSAVKVAKDLPLEAICLLGCGVGTGFGSAVNSAEVHPGDTVIIMGVGGIGINAVQGAAAAGADHVIAVDPVPFKQEKAKEFGATDTFADIAEADEFAKSVTNGQGADSAIVTTGVLKSEHIGQAFSAIRKAGTVVVTSLGDAAQVGIPVSLLELTLYQKRIQGALFGASNPSADIPRLIEMFQAGKLKLQELVSNTYTLDEVAQGFEDMHAGKNIRGVVIFD